jgi:HAD superfamily hydrolase (TIGR01549 family)
MTNQIDAILFDMGGTLRRSTKRDEATRVEYVKKILDLIGSDVPALEFVQLLITREKSYRKWAKQNLAELNESRLWTEWMLPDYPADKVAPMSVELNQLWRDAHGTRWMIPEARETILSLYRSGYRLGLVSNTTSSVEVPATLAKEGIDGCFDTIILSCVVGKRKPGADILLEAAERMQVRPERCAYIGDRPDRDVAAARRAGFTRTVILRDPSHPFKKPVTPETAPDQFIDNLKELLDIFPSRSGGAASVGPRYDISFSTMWGIKKFADLNDFLRAVPRLGMAAVELNHQIRPAMLESMDLTKLRVTSIHEPCPAMISSEELRKKDILLSSPDEARRRQGVDAIKRSIELAHNLDAHTVVVHPGQVQSDGAPEKELRALVTAGETQSPKFFEIRDRMIEVRASLIGPYMEAVKKSLLELLDHASKFEVRLGVENRYHHLDIPSLDEMGELLALAGSDRLGFLYDVGHAHALDRLGFYPHEEWLKRYASRIIGVHLHDALGADDHKAPGLGEVDFRMVAAYLPKDAYRALEVQSFNTPEQIRTGLKILVDTGCVNEIS